MRWLTNIFDKTGAVGALTAAMGCASCFPALGSLGASLGLGFLAHYEGVFINTLLPVFATIALAANVFSYFSHNIWHRTLAGIAGPIMVLLTLFPLWFYNWSTTLLYTGIALMLCVSIWDIVSPPQKVCRPCEAPTQTSEVQVP
ncbi:organomercurial transporter MerC [Beggiatoa alba]|nr:organomercurial transporter MerC [Beggiatoa alba]